MATTHPVPRLISFLTLAAFSLSFVLAQPLAAAAEALASHRRDADRLRALLESDVLPYGTGRVADGVYAGNDQLVVCIQDLHCHPEVQKNIAGIISFFDGRYGIRKIFVEGLPQGKADPLLLTAIPDKGIRKKAAERLLSKGLLGGGEYYAVINGSDNLYGLERWDVYRGNVELARRLLERRSSSAAQVRRLGAGIERLESIHLSSGLRRTAEKLRADASSTDHAAKRYALLRKAGLRAGERVEAYPNLERFLRVLELGRAVRRGRLNRELKAYAEGLKSVLPYAVYAPLLEKLDGGAGTQEFVRALAALAEAGAPRPGGRFSGVEALLEYVRLNYRINPLDLIEEERLFVERVLEKRAGTLAEEDVLFLARMCTQLGNLVELKALPAEFRDFVEQRERFRRVLLQYFDPGDAAGVIALLDDEELFRFYRVNVDRNAIFDRNIREALGIGAGGAPAVPGSAAAVLERLGDFGSVDVIVTGGFHREVAGALAAKGISSLTVIPNATTGYDPLVYELLLRNELDVRRIASSSLSPGSAAVIDAMSGERVVQLFLLLSVYWTAADAGREGMHGQMREWLATLREAAVRNGVRLPEDVRVAGRDGAYTVALLFRDAPPQECTFSLSEDGDIRDLEIRTLDGHEAARQAERGRRLSVRDPGGWGKAAIVAVGTFMFSLLQGGIGFAAEIVTRGSQVIGIVKAGDNPWKIARQYLQHTGIEKPTNAQVHEFLHDQILPQIGDTIHKGQEIVLQTIQSAPPAEALQTADAALQGAAQLTWGAGTPDLIGRSLEAGQQAVSAAAGAPGVIEAAVPVHQAVSAAPDAAAAVAQAAETAGSVLGDASFLDTLSSLFQPMADASILWYASAAFMIVTVSLLRHRAFEHYRPAGYRSGWETFTETLRLFPVRFADSLKPAVTLAMAAVIFGISLGGSTAPVRERDKASVSVESAASRATELRRLSEHGPAMRAALAIAARGQEQAAEPQEPESAPAPSEPAPAAAATEPIPEIRTDPFDPIPVLRAVIREDIDYLVYGMSREDAGNAAIIVPKAGVTDEVITSWLMKEKHAVDALKSMSRFIRKGRAEYRKRFDTDPDTAEIVQALRDRSFKGVTLRRMEKMLAENGFGAPHLTREQAKAVRDAWYKAGGGMVASVSAMARALGLSPGSDWLATWYNPYIALEDPKGGLINTTRENLARMRNGEVPLVSNGDKYRPLIIVRETGAGKQEYDIYPGGHVAVNNDKVRGGTPIILVLPESFTGSKPRAVLAIAADTGGGLLKEQVDIAVINTVSGIKPPERGWDTEEVFETVRKSKQKGRLPLGGRVNVYGDFHAGALSTARLAAAAAAAFALGVLGIGTLLAGPASFAPAAALLPASALSALYGATWGLGALVGRAVARAGASVEMPETGVRDIEDPERHGLDPGLCALVVREAGRIPVRVISAQESFRRGIFRSPHETARYWNGVVYIDPGWISKAGGRLGALKRFYIPLMLRHELDHARGRGELFAYARMVVTFVTSLLGATRGEDVLSAAARAAGRYAGSVRRSAVIEDIGQRPELTAAAHVFFEETTEAALALEDLAGANGAAFGMTWKQDIPAGEILSSVLVTLGGTQLLVDVAARRPSDGGPAVLVLAPSRKGNSPSEIGRLSADLRLDGKEAEKIVFGRAVARTLEEIARGGRLSLMLREAGLGGLQPWLVVLDRGSEYAHPAIYADAVETDAGQDAPVFLTRRVEADRTPLSAAAAQKLGIRDDLGRLQLKDGEYLDIGWQAVLRAEGGYDEGITGSDEERAAARKESLEGWRDGFKRARELRSFRMSARRTGEGVTTGLEHYFRLHAASLRHPEQTETQWRGKVSDLRGLGGLGGILLEGLVRNENGIPFLDPHAADWIAAAGGVAPAFTPEETRAFERLAGALRTEGSGVAGAEQNVQLDAERELAAIVLNAFERARPGELDRFLGTDAGARRYAVYRACGFDPSGREPAADEQRNIQLRKNEIRFHAFAQMIVLSQLAAERDDGRRLALDLPVPEPAQALPWLERGYGVAVELVETYGRDPAEGDRLVRELADSMLLAGVPESAKVFVYTDEKGARRIEGIAAETGVLSIVPVVRAPDGVPGASDGGSALEIDLSSKGGQAAQALARSLSRIRRAPVLIVKLIAAAEDGRVPRLPRLGQVNGIVDLYRILDVVASRLSGRTVLSFESFFKEGGLRGAGLARGLLKEDERFDAGLSRSRRISLPSPDGGYREVAGPGAALAVLAYEALRATGRNEFLLEDARTPVDYATLAGWTSGDWGAAGGDLLSREIESVRREIGRGQDAETALFPNARLAGVFSSALGEVLFRRLGATRYAGLDTRKTAPEAGRLREMLVRAVAAYAQVPSGTDRLLSLEPLVKAGIVSEEEAAASFRSILPRLKPGREALLAVDALWRYTQGRKDRRLLRELLAGPDSRGGRLIRESFAEFRDAPGLEMQVLLFNAVTVSLHAGGDDRAAGASQQELRRRLAGAFRGDIDDVKARAAALLLASAAGRMPEEVRAVLGAAERLEAFAARALSAGPTAEALSARWVLLRAALEAEGASGEEALDRMDNTFAMLSKAARTTPATMLVVLGLYLEVLDMKLDRTFLADITSGSRAAFVQTARMILTAQ